MPKKDRMPTIDALNGLLTAGFQLSLALVPFYCFLRIWGQAIIWALAAVVLGIILYFTWYKNLPAQNEGKHSGINPVRSQGHGGHGDR